VASKGKAPSFPFYPGDWLRDTGLQVCSIAARGLWIELLCIMHDGNPYGHLAVNGNPIPARVIASRISGVNDEEYAKLLNELQLNGVCSVTDEGTVYSRRLVRDQERRELAKEYGSRGGNPALKGGVKGGDNPTVGSGVKGKDKLRLQKQYAKAKAKEEATAEGKSTSRKPRKTDKAGVDAYCTATGFDEWYTLYGARKPGTKRQAQWAWVKLPKKLAAEMFDITVEYLRLRDEAGEDDKYLFAPHNFLDVADEHWTDKPTQRGNGNGKAKKLTKMDIDYWEQNLGRAPQSFRDDLKARDPARFKTLMDQWDAWVATQENLAKVVTEEPPDLPGEECDDVPF
jgi:hypothetical protein